MLDSALKSFRIKSWHAVLAALFVVAAPTAALAARGYTTANVHMRAGPGTEYPVVDTVPDGARVTIHGCLSDVEWCDVSRGNDRGWISANYLNYFYRNRYVYLPDYFQVIEVPIVTFSVDTYWRNHYVGRPWYHRRAHWARFWREHGRHGHDRGHHKHVGRPGGYDGKHHGRDDRRGDHRGVVSHPRHEDMSKQRHHRPATVHRHAPEKQVARPHHRPHAARPHINRLHTARPHRIRPHASRPHMNRPHVSRPQMGRPHLARPSGRNAHARGGLPGRGRHH